MRKLGGVGFAVYFIVGLYFINESLNIIPSLTNLFSGIDRWISLLAGILIILGGFYFLKANKYSSF